MSTLSSSQVQTITAIREKVKDALSNAEAGHDWWHIHRVYVNAARLCKSENVNEYVVLLAALLHDIADAKFHDGDESIGPRVAESFMHDENIDDSTMGHVINIVKHMSFKNSLDGQSWSSIEMEVVQDADRLDAIGAIGIARAFSYGGHKGRIFFDPAILPMDKMTKKEYKNSTAPTINHFYEKLLLLKNKMNTQAGLEMAQERHNYMVSFLKQFYGEWFDQETVPSEFQNGL